MDRQIRQHERIIASVSAGSKTGEIQLWVRNQDEDGAACRYLTVQQARKLAQAIFEAVGVADKE